MSTDNLSLVILSNWRSVVRLAAKVARGGYDDRDLAGLKKLIHFANIRLSISNKLISQNGGPSVDVIRNITGGGRPKLENFLSATNGIRTVLEVELTTRGIMSGLSRGTDGPMLINTHVLTEKGQILALIENLDKFRRQFRSINDIEQYVTNDYREQLIALLENLIAQLKTPVTDLRTVDCAFAELTKLGQKIADKLRDKGAESVVDKIVALFNSIFG